MAIRFYLMPKIGTGLGDDPFRAKYVNSGLMPTSGRYQAIDYGKEDWFLVAVDVTASEHTAIAANADVTAVPANLDNTIGGALATVQAALELANIPAHWATSGMTYRTLVKWTIRILLLMQRFRGLDPSALRLFLGGITLDGTVGDIPATPRRRLNNAALSFGLDTSSITLATTIREALRILGQQMTFPVAFGGEDFS